MHSPGEWAELGDRLRQARLKVGLTQVEVAALFKRDQSFIAKTERGERQLTALELRDLCRVYNVPADSIFRPQD